MLIIIVRVLFKCIVADRGGAQTLCPFGIICFSFVSSNVPNFTLPPLTFICLFIYYGGVSLPKRHPSKKRAKRRELLCSSFARHTCPRTSLWCVTATPAPSSLWNTRKRRRIGTFLVVLEKTGKPMFETPRRAIGLARLKAIEVRVGTPL